MLTFGNKKRYEHTTIYYPADDISIKLISKKNNMNISYCNIQSS